MAGTRTTPEVASGSVICKSWVLKVSIHCEGCKREVKKALQKLQGVCTISVDSEKNEVRVGGNIGSEALLNRLSRMGKHAEIVHQKSPPAKQNPGPQRTTRVEPASSKSNGGQRKTAAAAQGAAAAAGDTGSKSESAGNNSKAGGRAVPTNGKGIKKGSAEEALPNAGFIYSKQRKPKSEEGDKKEEEDVQQSQSQSQSQDIVLSYHQCAPLQASVYSDADQGKVIHEAGQEEVKEEASVNSFDLFSEENANGCSIM